MPTFRVVTAAVLIALHAIAADASAQAADTTSRQGWLPVEHQLRAAVLALPEEFRSGAKVLGYRGRGATLSELRSGTGPFTCLAPNPGATSFHVACYHNSLEPFMARGRALRSSGVPDNQVDSTRFREVATGQISMPAQPAALYSLTGPVGSYQADSAAVHGARPLFVVYIPGATSATTGLSDRPAVGTPWIMFPGTPKAHIMFVPRM